MSWPYNWPWTSKPRWTWKEVNRYGEAQVTFMTPARYVGVCPEGHVHETTNKEWSERIHPVTPSRPRRLTPNDH